MDIKRSTIAVTQAESLSLQHLPELQIRNRGKIASFLMKSMSFAMQYQGYGQQPDTKNAKEAGTAAFLASAYDVVSDWKIDKIDWIPTYRDIVKKYAGSDMAAEAEKLLERDVNVRLRNDGLERGEVAFPMVLRHMDELEAFSKKTDPAYTGYLIQIMDDLNDHESDFQFNEQNCLRTSNRDRHLESFIRGTHRDMIKDWFPHSAWLQRMIQGEREKASLLLNRINI
jgi:hypothetical protein